jgi:hypothetical protein
MAKLRPGTTQSSMPDGEDHYVIEQWNGRRWITITAAGTFPTKKAADHCGFKLSNLHKK